MSLLYEIATDCAVMPGIMLDYGYWHARANWGLSERDILNGSLAFAGLGAFALVSHVYPEARTPSNMAVLFVTTPLERFAAWMYRKERWFYVARLIFLGLVAWQCGRTLFVAVPMFFMQGGVAQVQNNDRELAAHGAHIEALEKRLDKMDDQKVGERLALVEKSVNTTGQVSTACLIAIFGYIIKEVLAVLKMRGKTDAS
jgi:hypothetical protein